MQDGSVSPAKAFFRNKWVLLILAIDIAVVIFIIVISINKAIQTATLNFNIAPVDVTITVNGSGGCENNGQTCSFTPGTYEVQISHPDLDTKTFTVNLEANTNTTITTFLSKDNGFYFYTLKDNLGAFYRLAEIASAGDNQTTDHDTSAEAFITNFQEQYNLYTTELPVTYSEYNEKGELIKYVTVRAGAGCAITLCLEATIFDKNDKNIALKLLEEAGFNVEDFEIEYKIY